MTSKAVIRGVEKGTLVLVDGVPINQGGRYNLEDIPVESIDRVEVVRGGGAVLYGSEANGGVINIITKGKRANTVKAGFGNYGIQNYAASFQAGKLGFTAAYDHTGKIDNISAPTTSTKRGSPRGLYYNIKRGSMRISMPATISMMTCMSPIPMEETATTMCTSTPALTMRPMQVRNIKMSSIVQKRT